jgi:hypothetical protein
VVVLSLDLDVRDAAVAVLDLAGDDFDVASTAGLVADDDPAFLKLTADFDVVAVDLARGVADGTSVFLVLVLPVADGVCCIFDFDAPPENADGGIVVDFILLADADVALIGVFCFLDLDAPPENANDMGRSGFAVDDFILLADADF